MLRIIPDATYPGMFRLDFGDGQFSDMVNATWIKDALRECTQRETLRERAARRIAGAMH